MAYETLKSDIQSYVKQNGEGAITGDGLQSILLEIVNTLGTGFKYVGVATPSTSPGTPTENVFYIGGGGIYANFGSTIEVEAYQICVFAYNGSWSKSVINVGSSFDVEDDPAGASVEFTFYSAETPNGRSIKINKDVSDLSNEPDEAISQWWAAQKERKINLIAGYTIDFDSLDASSPSSLGVFKAIQAGQIIDSYTNATSLIFGTDGGQSVTINKSQLPYTATANLINVKSASDTLSNVSIKVRGSLENMPSYININEIANHPAAYANAAAALADVPEIYRRKNVKVVYFDDDMQLPIEMLCIDDYGIDWDDDWWTNMDNWAIEGPIRTEINEGGTSARQLDIAGDKRANMDDFLNVNVWNATIYPYETKEDARLAVPIRKRKVGLTITYLLDDGWITEQFTALLNWGTDSVWIDDDNWKVTGPVSVSQNKLTIGGQATNIRQHVVNVNDINGVPTTPYNQLTARYYVPQELRIPGLVITFLTNNGWHIQQFRGSDITDWLNPTLWFEDEKTISYLYNILTGADVVNGTYVQNGVILSDGTFSSNTDYVIKEYSVSEGDVYIISSRLTSNSNKTRALIYAYNDTTPVEMVLQASAGVGQYTFFKYTVPNGVNRICVYNSSGYPQYVGKVTSLGELVKINDDLNYILPELNYLENSIYEDVKESLSYQNASGSIPNISTRALKMPASNEYYRIAWLQIPLDTPYKQIEVKAQDTVDYAGVQVIGYTASAPENGTIYTELSYTRFTHSDNIITNTIEVTDDIKGKYLIVSYHVNGIPTISGIKKVSKIDKNTEDIEQLKNDPSSAFKLINRKIDIKKQDLKILHIGNSFTSNSTDYLSAMIDAVGIDVIGDNALRTSMYYAVRAGATFKNWYDCYHDNDTASYGVYRRFGPNLQVSGEGAAGNGTVLRTALQNVAWDIIVIQPQSGCPIDFNDWEKHDDNGYLIEWVRLLRTLQPQAEIGINFIHAAKYAADAKDMTQVELWQGFTKAYKEFVARYDVDFMIPYGTAIENIKMSVINTTAYGFESDKRHLADGVGKYVANAAYFQTLIAPRYGISILGNTYRYDVTDDKQSATYPDELISVTNDNAYVCQMAAILACNDFYNRQNPDNIIL